MQPVVPERVEELVGCYRLPEAEDKDGGWGDSAVIQLTTEQVPLRRAIDVEDLDDAGSGECVLLACLHDRDRYRVKVLSGRSVFQEAPDISVGWIPGAGRLRIMTTDGFQGVYLEVWKQDGKFIGEYWHHDDVAIAGEPEPPAVRLDLQRVPCRG